MVLDRDGDRVIRPARFPLAARCRCSADAEAIARFDLIRLGDADHVAGFGLLEALGGTALQREQRAGPLGLARRRRQFGAFGQGCTEHATDGEAANGGFVAHLEYLDRGSVDTKPLGGLSGRGGIVAQ